MAAGEPADKHVFSAQTVRARKRPRLPDRHAVRMGLRSGGVREPAGEM